MAAIFQTTFSDAFSWMKMYGFSIKISLKFVPNGPINNIPALVQIMAWRQTGDMEMCFQITDLLWGEWSLVDSLHKGPVMWKKN